MAFAQVASVTVTEGSGTSIVGNYPATVNAGDLLLVLVGQDDDTAVSSSDFDEEEFELLANQNFDACLAAYAKVADGTEGGSTYAITSAASEDWGCQCFRITDWYGSLPDGLYSATAATGSAIDPPNLAPGLGALDFLWLAFGTGGRNANDITAAPSNYTDLTIALDQDGDDAWASARRELNAESENPGTFTWSSAGGFGAAAATIAIRPGAAAVTVTDVDPDTFADGDTGIDITGTNFGASQGSGEVLLSPTDDVDDAGAVSQTVTAWGDTSITFTVVDTDLDTGTVYVFVVNDSAASNASGFAVSLYHEYSASLSGTVTPVGAASRATSKPLAGSVTPAGALASTLAHLVLLAGSLTPSGAVVRAASKVLAGVLTPAGAASKAASKPLVGSVTPSGALVRAMSKSLAGSLGLAGAVSKAASKVLAGSVTPSGSATYLKQVFVSLSGAITPAGAVVRSVSKGLGGSVAGAGGLVQSASKVLGGSVSGAGAVSRSASKVIAGSVSPAGAAAKSTTKAAVGSVTGSGGLENATSKGLAGEVSGAGSVSKSVHRGFAGSVGASGSLVKTAVKAGIAGVVTGAGGLIRATTKGLTSSVAGAGEVSLTPRVVIRRILMRAWDRARLLVNGGDRPRLAPDDDAGDRERFGGRDAGE